jgi:hypothetical protein
MELSVSQLLFAIAIGFAGGVGVSVVILPLFDPEKPKKNYIEECDERYD